MYNCSNPSVPWVCEAISRRRRGRTFAWRRMQAPLAPLPRFPPPPLPCRLSVETLLNINTYLHHFDIWRMDFEVCVMSDSWLGDTALCAGLIVGNFYLSLGRHKLKQMPRSFNTIITIVSLLNTLVVIANSVPRSIFYCIHFAN